MNIGGVLAAIHCATRHRQIRYRHSQSHKRLYSGIYGKHTETKKPKTEKLKEEKSGIEAVFEKNIGIGVDG